MPAGCFTTFGAEPHQELRGAVRRCPESIGIPPAWASAQLLREADRSAWGALLNVASAPFSASKDPDTPKTYATMGDPVEFTAR